MIIKQLNLHHLKPGLRIPERNILHVWILALDHTGNMHKSIHTQSHSLLFRMLSLYTGIPGESLELGTGQYGKPFLKNNLESEGVPLVLHFNLSHSGSMAAFVFSSSSPVGIDIERLHRSARMNRIAARVFFPNETAQLEALSEQDSQDENSHLFYRLWTRTESFLKGIGTGFSASLTDKKIQDEYTHWEIRYPDAPDGYICCLAYKNPPDAS